MKGKALEPAYLAKAFEVYASEATSNINNQVEAYLKARNLEHTCMYRHYAEALNDVWPSLKLVAPEASRFLSVHLYMEAAEAKGFKIHPECLRCTCTQKCAEAKLN